LPSFLLLLKGQKIMAEVVFTTRRLFFLASTALLGVGGLFFFFFFIYISIYNIVISFR
jgi:hypothetical protein